VGEYFVGGEEEVALQSSFNGADRTTRLSERVVEHELDMQRVRRPQRWAVVGLVRGILRWMAPGADGARLPMRSNDREHQETSPWSNHWT